ncbi:MAG: Nramp family divalent metal transporter [Myxococcota bacterium]|nr:Nramp family divalent metal transporter [Myxococcota bacterium]
MSTSSNLWHRLGPGILLAATSIGASHLVHSPRAGALYGFHLLWLIVASHLFKYPAFEIGPRYAAATGHHLLHGYARVPGPRHWPLWLFASSTVLQGIGVLAGVVNISGCVLATWFGHPATPIYLGLNATEVCSIALLMGIIALLYFGGFSWLDHLGKIMVAVLTLATVMAFIPVCPSPGDLKHMVIPAIPVGSIVLVAAILGWMPTGIDVSVWHSIWTLKKIRHWGNGGGASPMADHRRYLKASLTDMRVGYGLSLITGLMFAILGAAHLSGQGDAMSGAQFAQAISSAYTAIWGRWMYHVFMLTAFFAMFSTSYTVVDGFSRSFSEVVAILSPRYGTPPNRRRTYFGFALLTGILAVATIASVGNPVTLVVIVSLISLGLAPVLYGLNLYCVSRHIEDPDLSPPRVTIMLGWAGAALMLCVFLVAVYLRLR